jgi:hypothetical protein
VLRDGCEVAQSAGNNFSRRRSLYGACKEHIQKFEKLVPLLPLLLTTQPKVDICHPIRSYEGLTYYMEIYTDLLHSHIVQINCDLWRQRFYTFIFVALVWLALCNFRHVLAP